MKIYCIIITYNGSKWIVPCIQSILSSTINIQIVVIDNGSGDNTTDLIKAKFPNIILVENKINLGFGKANNIGFRLALYADADYVFLLNQDACVEENTIEKLIEASKKNLEFGIISPIQLTGNGDELDMKFSNNISVNKKLFFDALMNSYKSGLYEVPFVNAAGWLMTKKILLTIGGFDPIFFHYGEDSNYCQRAIFHKFKVGIVPEVFIRHDREQRSRTEVLLFSEDYFKQYNNDLKCKYGNINFTLSKGITRREKIRTIKLMIKSLFKLKLSFVYGYLRQYDQINKTFELIFKSRFITSTEGEHYLPESSNKELFIKSE